jgi:hypothetical protein
MLLLHGTLSMLECAFNANHPLTHLRPWGAYLSGGREAGESHFSVLPKILSLRHSERVAILGVRHGSWRFLAITPTLGKGVQDQVTWRPGGGRSPWVLEEVPRRWGGTIPLVARVAEGVATRLADGVCTRAPGVRISVENLGGRRVACCSRETLLPHRS